MEDLVYPGSLSCSESSEQPQFGLGCVFVSFWDVGNLVAASSRLVANKAGEKDFRMNLQSLRNKLSPNEQQRFDTAVDSKDLNQVVGVLIDNALFDEAIDYCECQEQFSLALDIATQAHRFERAGQIAQSTGSAQKLAETLVLKGDKDGLTFAADIYASLHQYAKAAKIYRSLSCFERAAEFYIQANRFVDAVMCYQQAGNLTKQLSTQIAAFEYELTLANGDINAVSEVSKAMASAAAMSFLKNPDTEQKAIDLLEKIDQLQTAAQKCTKEGRFELAGVCYLRMGALKEARRAFIAAHDADNALAVAKKINNPEIELDTLKQLGLYYKLGQKLIALNRFDDALIALKFVDENDPSSLSAIELRGDIYCKKKDYLEAINCYDPLLQSNVKLQEARICRIAYKDGYCYEAIGDKENALAVYRKAYLIDPEFHDISSVIARLKQSLQIDAQDGFKRGGLEPIDGQRRRNTYAHQSSLHPSSTGRQISGTRISTIRIGNKEIPAIGNDRYKIECELAHGGMGVVYKATDVLLMRTVALKVLSNKLKDNDIALEYFMREARASAALQHVNIVTIYDFGSLNDGSIFIAMECIEGKNLKQIVTQTGPFPTNFLVQVAIHTCRGLQYAHDNGIIHRDVKSSNIMIAKDKTVKILDMGLAKIVNAEDKNSTQAIGTPYYMSPEQVLGIAIDCRSDIYSLGVTLYECATGVLPFLKGDLPYKHVHEAPPPLHLMNGNVDPTIERIVLKMMEKKPEDRFDSCNDCIKALQQVEGYKDFFSL